MNTKKIYKLILLIMALATGMLFLLPRVAIAAGGPYGPYGPIIPEPTDFAGKEFITTAGIVLYGGGIGMLAYAKLIKNKVQDALRRSAK